MIRVAIADDHPVVLEALRSLIGDQPDMEVVMSAQNGQIALDRLGACDCDVLVLDLSLPGVSGFGVMQALRQVAPEVRVVVYTMYPGEFIRQGVEAAGARAWVCKRQAPTELIAAIRAVATTQTTFDAPPDTPLPHETLSTRQFEMFLRLCQGATPGDLSREFDLSPSTVNGHPAEVRRKLGVETNGEVLVYAMMAGLVSPEATSCRMLADMPNLQLTRQRDLSSFRMMALGTWRTAKDPSVYGSLSLDMEATLAFIDRWRAATGRRLTVSHVMAKAVGLVLVGMPEANAILRFNRIYRRTDVDVFFQVAMRDPESGQLDLSGLTIRRADQKPLEDIVDAFEHEVAVIREGKDPELEHTRATFKRMPGFLVGRALDLLGLLLYGFNLDLRFLGLPRDPFGSIMVTNIGSLGLEEAYAPLVPYSHVPLVLALGSVEKRAMVDAATDAIEVRRMMRVFATFDHRLLDGAHAAALARRLREVFEDPDTHFGPIPAAAHP